LAALVLNSFRGVQERARDTERRTDINAQATQLEVYYTDNGGYPQFTGQVDTDSWITANMKGADLNSWRAPGFNTNTMVNSATPTKDQYGYTPLQADGSTACTTAPCAKYKLFWYSEKTATVTSKDSLN
jgi:type II secretory pathway pseudopilin PulG